VKVVSVSGGQTGTVRAQVEKSVQGAVNNANISPRKELNKLIMKERMPKGKRIHEYYSMDETERKGTQISEKHGGGTVRACTTLNNREAVYNQRIGRDSLSPRNQNQ